MSDFSTSGDGAWISKHRNRHKQCFGSECRDNMDAITWSLKQHMVEDFYLYWTVVSINHFSKSFLKNIVFSSKYVFLDFCCNNFNENMKTMGNPSKLTTLNINHEEYLH